MRQGLPGWTGALALCGATTLLGGERAPAARLDVGGVELVRLPPASRRLVVEELARVLDPSGVRIVWRWMEPQHESPAHELRVAFLQSRGRGAHAGSSVLAATGPTGRAASVWVYVPKVSSALGYLWLPGSLGGQRDLGTALGRVVAHEIVHAVAPGLPHGDGLMAARFHLGHLVLDEATLDADGARALVIAAGEWQARGGPLPAPESIARASAASQGAVLPGAP